MYNYYDAVKQDVREWISENVNLELWTDKEDLAEYLNNALWTADSVTGNASGSYFFNTYEAEKALAGNWNLLREAREEFGDTRDVLEIGAEACDVTIRCYLLSSVIAEILDEIELTEA